MLSKNNRLKTLSDFRAVFNKGKVSENQFLRVKFIKNQKTDSKFGFIVSSKFSKKSVIRNSMKRRLRAIIRSLLKKIKPGFDVIIWPKKNAGMVDFENLSYNLKNLLTKNDLLSV